MFALSGGTDILVALGVLIGGMGVLQVTKSAEAAAGFNIFICVTAILLNQMPVELALACVAVQVGAVGAVRLANR